MAVKRFKMPQFTNNVNIPGYGRIDTDGGGWLSTADATLQGLLIAAGAVSETEILADNTGSTATAGQTTIVQVTADTALTPDHVGKQINNATGTNITLTIKKSTALSAGLAWAAGNVIAVSRTGAGTVTLAIDAGATLNNVGPKTVAQNDTPLVLQCVTVDAAGGADVFNTL